MRQRLDTQPIRRRLVAGTYTAADVRALLDEVMAQRQENTALVEQLGRRRAMATAVLTPDAPILPTDPAVP